MRLPTENHASTLHPAAAQGFEAGAATYVAGRPDYPEAALDWLQHDLGLQPGANALDLGAGTGKFLKLLNRTGAALIAVEPVAAMREALKREFPFADVREGSAEALPVGDGELDVIVCAQSFHWFADAAALAEMRRALKIGGRLGLIWNVRDERVGWVAQLTQLIAPYEGGAPRYASGRWREAFPALGFSPLVERVFAHAHVGAPEQVIVDRMLSTSFIAALSASARARLADDIRAVIAAAPELRGSDSVAFPYRTHAFSAVRTG